MYNTKKKNHYEAKFLVFKNTRTASTVKHTGMIFHVENYGTYVHEVSAPSEGILEAKAKIRTYKIDMKEYLKYEEIVDASNTSLVHISEVHDVCYYMIH